MATISSNTVKRAAAFAPGIGQSLDRILNQDVIVARVKIEERQMDGEARTIVMLTLDNGDLYHAWSDSLAEKLSQIPESEYPLTFKFNRAATRRGFNTYIFE